MHEIIEEDIFRVSINLINNDVFYGSTIRISKVCLCKEAGGSVQIKTHISPSYLYPRYKENNAQGNDQLTQGQADEVLAEEQARLRPSRSTEKQIFNIRVIIDKRLQHQRDLFHNFID